MDQRDDTLKRNRGQRWRPWRRQPEQPQPAPEWPTDQADRPTWATEQQQLLPAVEPVTTHVIRECGDMR